ncbi:GNAT family N-acetyltransferase [Dyella japonica]|uniref:GNAT superfamily N-acetyltransferase n=1 Tax=Dyella japonica TaxID=231455 RepID=A0ABV2JX57_9GAMM
MPAPVVVREIHPDEHRALGQLMVHVYGNLPGFPTPTQQPHYYDMLANIGDFTRIPQAKVLVAVDAGGQVVGGVVYFADITQYGAAMTMSMVDTSAIRLLAVHPSVRGQGVGRQLMEACLQLARDHGHARVVLHTTEAMRVAWNMYERMGFQRAHELDFAQGDLQVYGLHLVLRDD